MNKKMKTITIVSLILVVLILFAGCQSSNETTKVDEPESLTLQIGDYLQFGSYKNHPILWQVINITDDNQYLLWSKDVITFKAFDGAESGKSFYTNDDKLLFSIGADDFIPGFDRENSAENREAFGSNRWKTSNIREWLNSNETDVQYTTVPPNADSVYHGINAYHEEEGFLTNFSDAEKLLLVQSQLKTVLCDFDVEYAEGGTEVHEYEWGVYPSMAMNNYDKSYYETSTDKVFILSLEELYKYVEENELDWMKKATEYALPEYQGTIEMENGNYDYLLRTPYPTRGHSLRRLSGDKTVDSWHAYAGDLGIVPAVYINTELYHEAGEGTLESPYMIKY